VRISHGHKFYFISIPKTGSETIRSLLNPYSDVLSQPRGEFSHHITELQMESSFERHGWNIGDYFGFTAVRNPWARLVSWHNYKLRIGGNPPTPYLREHANSFYENCRAYASTSERFTQRVKAGTALDLAPQTSFFLEGHESKLTAIRLENLSGELSRVLTILGIAHEHLDLGRNWNRSTFGDFREYYDDEAVEIAHRKYASDCLRFGYEFDAT